MEGFLQMELSAAYLALPGYHRQDVEYISGVPWRMATSPYSPESHPISKDILSSLAKSSPRSDLSPPPPLARYLLSSPKGTSLRYIFWCCDGLGCDKLDVVVGLVTTESPDVVVLTNVGMAHSLVMGKINALTCRLQRMTGLMWKGLSSPDSHACLGGTIILHSSRISNPIVHHLLPFGSLTSFSGSWDNSDFTILSIQWNLGDDEPWHPSFTDHNLWRVQMLWGLINDITKDCPTVLCGAFGLCAGDLDRRLLSDTLLARRIPFLGPHLAVVYEMPTPQSALGLDHIVSNLTGGITGRLVSTEDLHDGHLPIVVDMTSDCFLNPIHPPLKPRTHRSLPISLDISCTLRSLSKFRPQDHTLPSLCRLSDTPNDAIVPLSIATPTWGGHALNNAI